MLRDEEINLKLTHLKPDEVIIFKKYYRVMSKNFINMIFDLHLGEGIKLEKEYDENIMRMAKTLSQKRVDVVIEYDKEIKIIELKKRAGLDTLGQLLGYEDLYIKEYKPSKKVIKLLVCEEIEPDVETILKKNNIDIFFV